MNDRNTVKWQPFNSVINGKIIINELRKEKEKSIKPIFFEDKINLLEEKIIEAYFECQEVKITYFQNGHFLSIVSKIKKIDQIYKMIYLKNIKILFNQIISIEEI